jgi:hypothetical protein
MPDVSGEPVVTNARAFYPPRAAAGATGARHSPLPSWGSVCSPLWGGPVPSRCIEGGSFSTTRAHRVAGRRRRMFAERSEDSMRQQGSKSGLLGFARNAEQKSISSVAVCNSNQKCIGRFRPPRSRPPAPAIARAWIASDSPSWSPRNVRGCRPRTR